MGSNKKIDAITDQRNQGMNWDTATDRAIIETGDAADVVMRLDREHRPKPQWGEDCNRGLFYGNRAYCGSCFGRCKQH